MTVYIHTVHGCKKKIVFTESQAKITYFIETTHKIHVWYVFKQAERDSQHRGRGRVIYTCNYANIYHAHIERGGQREYAII